MSDAARTAAAHQAAAAARCELSGRVLAATLGAVRDLDVAEEATAEAFLLAVTHWPTSGVPASVEAWLITAARRRAIDRMRRARVARDVLARFGQETTARASLPADTAAQAPLVPDDELRLAVLCCDPRLAHDDQIALTLRLACGLSTAGVAAGLGVSTPTMAARLTRAKARLSRSGPRFELPDDASVDARLPQVAAVIHAAFGLGHTRRDGPGLVDEDLSDRAQYLAETLHRLRPGRVEFRALLALLLLTRGRAPGRSDPAGVQVLLADADRLRWDRALLTRGIQMADQVWATGYRGSLAVQAAIAAEHARAPSFVDTDWAAVLDRYGLLLSVDPNPIHSLGRCLARGQCFGPAVGLADLDEVLALPEIGDVLRSNPYTAAARGALLDRLGRAEEAAGCWKSAAELAYTGAERDFSAATAGQSRERCGP